MAFRRLRCASVEHKTLFLTLLLPLLLQFSCCLWCPQQPLAASVMCSHAPPLPTHLPAPLLTPTQASAVWGHMGSPAAPDRKQVDNRLRYERKPDRGAAASAAAAGGMPAPASEAGSSSTELGAAQQAGENGTQQVLAAMRVGAFVEMGPHPRPLGAQPLVQLTEAGGNTRLRTITLRVLAVHGQSVQLTDRVAGKDRGLLKVAIAMCYNGQAFMVVSEVVCRLVGCAWDVGSGDGQHA